MADVVAENRLHPSEQVAVSEPSAGRRSIASTMRSVLARLSHTRRMQPETQVPGERVADEERGAGDDQRDADERARGHEGALVGRTGVVRDLDATDDREHEPGGQREAARATAAAARPRRPSP